MVAGVRRPAGRPATRSACRAPARWPSPASPSPTARRARSLVVPRVLVGRRDGRAWVTEFSPATAPRPCGRSRPVRPSGTLRYADGLLPVDRYRSAVAEAVRRMRAGELDKAALAHDLLAVADDPLDPRFLLGGLARALPDLLVVRGRRAGRAPPRSCWCGAAAATRAVAGAGRHGLAGQASGRRGPAPGGCSASAKDRHEHALAVESLAAALRPLCARARRAGHAGGDRAAQRLAPGQRRARHGSTRARPPSLLQLAEAVHPTAAVGGTPRDAALALIAELEGMDRGRYAGPGRLGGRAAATASWGSRCAARSSTGRSRGCSPAAGSSPTPIPTPRCGRPRRSWSPCATRWRARTEGSAYAVTRAARAHRAACDRRRRSGGVPGPQPGAARARHLDQPQPRRAAAAAAASASGSSHARVRHPGRGAQRGEVDRVRGAEDALERGGVLRRALLQQAEDAAAAVVEHDDREVGARLVRADDQAGGVVQQREVAEQRVARARRGPARRRPRWTPCRRCRRRPGWPARSGRAAVPRPARRRGPGSTSRAPAARPPGSAATSARARRRPAGRGRVVERRVQRGRRRAVRGAPAVASTAAAGRSGGSGADGADRAGDVGPRRRRPGRRARTPRRRGSASSRCTGGAASGGRRRPPGPAAAVRRGARAATARCAAPPATPPRPARRSPARGQRRAPRPARRARRRRASAPPGRAAAARRCRATGGRRRSTGRRRAGPRVRSPPPSGTSGSANGRLRCTGPGGPPRAGRRGDRAADDARHAGARSPGDRDRRAAASRTALAEEPGWTIVWLAPVPISCGGPVGGEREQRHAGVRRLQHGGVQVRRGRARGRAAPAPAGRTAARARARGTRPCARRSARAAAAGPRRPRRAARTTAARCGSRGTGRRR